MEPELIARAVAIGRVGFGLGLAIAPLRLTRTWLGGGAESSAAQTLARSLGARDLVLGGGALTSDRDELVGWLLAGITADAADLVIMLAAGSLPPRGRVLGAAAAGAGIAMGTAAVVRLRRD